MARAVGLRLRGESGTTSPNDYSTEDAALDLNVQNLLSGVIQEVLRMSPGWTPECTYFPVWVLCVSSLSTDSGCGSAGPVGCCPDPVTLTVGAGQERGAQDLARFKHKAS